MLDELPAEFDLIVVGTGLTESIIAAAASRVGKTVLHLDPNDYYGGHWASFNLEAIQSLCAVDAVTEKNALTADHKMKLNDNICRLRNVTQKWTVMDNAVDAAEEVDAEDSRLSAQQAAMKEFRKFNVDITPKLLYSKGELVELLISSNICRYAEFRSVDRVITRMADGSLKQVPCTRSDIFSSAEVSNVERRLLMKHTMSCMNFAEDSDEFRAYADKTFAEYLTDKRLTPKLLQYVLYSISLGDERTSCFEGVRAVQKFLNSAGRYGDTPFLFPMYGCGEVPQCFCRLCAVFGGVYCLKRAVSEIAFGPNATTDGGDGGALRFRSITCGGQQISAKDIVFGHGTVDGAMFEKPQDEAISATPKCGDISRGIFLIDRPLGDETLNNGGGGVNLIKLPPAAERPSHGGAFVIQLAHNSGTCPKNWYIVHITCKSQSAATNGAEEDLAPYVQQLFHTTPTPSEETAAPSSSPSSPSIVWSMYFSIPSCQKCGGLASAQPFAGLHLTCGPYFELDYDQSIKEARSIFAKLFANEEFLPRAPDPEEIIIGGDEADDGQTVEQVGEAMADVSLVEVAQIAEDDDGAVVAAEEAT